MAVLTKDVNSVAVAGGVSDLDGVTILPFEINHSTGRLKVSGIISGGGGTTVLNEIVSGSGTSWTLANAPNANGVALYGAGIRLTPGAGNDYTLSGASITTANSYSAGSLLADYAF